MALLAMHVIALHAIIAAVTPLGGNSTYITLQLVTVESSATQRGASSASVQREKNASHYGDPKTGCLPGEISARIVGVKGDVCAPPCNGLDKLCPKDVPAGATATPLCTLLNPDNSRMYCGLICSPPSLGDHNQCGSGGKVSCKAVQGLGICTYDD